MSASNQSVLTQSVPRQPSPVEEAAAAMRDLGLAMAQLAREFQQFVQAYKAATGREWADRWGPWIGGAIMLGTVVLAGLVAVLR